MAKYTCPTCNKPCDSEGGCWKHKFHKGLSTNSTLKRGEKLKIRKKSIEEIEENKIEREKMWDFFNMLWDKLEIKKCWACGTPIYGENLSIYWDHCIEKSSHPELKYEEENMFFCCGDCHTLKTNGHAKPLHVQAIVKAIKRFNV